MINNNLLNAGDIVKLESDNLYGIIVDVNYIDEYINVIYEDGSWKDYNIWDALVQLRFIEKLPINYIDDISALMFVFTTINQSKLDKQIKESKILQYIQNIKSKAIYV